MLKHKSKIQDFIDYLKTNSPVETTTRYIAETFFNNNKDLSTKVIKLLKDKGILMTNKSWCKGKGQKWYYLDNDCSIEDLIGQVPVNQVPVNQVPVNQVPVNQVPVNQVPVNQVPVNQVPVNQVPVNQVPVNQVPVNQVPVKFNYKGIKEVETFITIEDKKIAKDTFEMLGDLFNEHRFTLSLTSSGLSKEKSWFLYNKIVEKNSFYTKQNFYEDI